MSDKPELHVVSFSGGKDSTAMLLRMLEEGMPVDVVIFCDTGMEFPDLYAHIDLVEKNTGIKITRIKTNDTFENMLGHNPVHKRDGTITNGYGWAGARSRWCTSKLKDGPREKYLRELRKDYTIIQYVGIAADEQYRLERKCNCREEVRHPLVDWNMTEADCLQYCRERGYNWNGLYDVFSRVSCWCCPLQSIPELKKLYENYPDLWQELKRLDSISFRTFKKGASVDYFEKRFMFEDEWIKAGKKLYTREFFTALREKVKADE